MNTTSHMIEARGGLKLHVREAGEGPAILFVHCVLCDGSMFDPPLAELSRDHRVLSMDLRGHGRSEVRGAYTVRDVSKDIVGVLDALDIPRAVIAGHGIGGVAALHVALANPDRVSALVLMNTTADEESTVGAVKARAFGMALQLGGPRKELLQLATRSLFSHTCKVAHPDIVERWIEQTAEVDGAGVRLALDMMARRPSLDQRLERLDQRTLVIAGSEDTVTPWALQQRLVDRMPRARMKTIQRAGHLAPIEKPGELTELLRAFTRELREGIRDDRTGRLIGKS